MACPTEINLSQKNIPIFLTRHWISAFSEYILDDSSDCVQITSNESQGILPFYCSGKRTLHSLTNYYSPYYQTFESHLDEPINIRMLLEKKSFTKLTMLPITDEVADSLKKQLIHSNYYIEKYYHTTNWRHCGINSYEDFKSKCSTNIIKSTERYCRKLEKNEAFTIKIYKNQFNEKIFSDYCKVYTSSWKKTEANLAFLKRVYEQASLLGQLRIGFIYYENLPVSVQVWFCTNEQAFIYKLAYDESYADYRVGNVLFLLMAKHAIEVDQVETLDFLTGNDRYKSKWMTQSRTLYGVNIYNKSTVAGYFGYLSSATRHWLKNLVPKSLFD